MNIDPRVMKQLLQLQVLSKSSLLTSDSGANSENSDMDFGSLLNSLMGQSFQPLATKGSINSSLSTKGVLAASFAGLTQSYNPNQAVGKPSSFDGFINQASTRYGVNTSLVKAVIHHESSYNPHAVSTAGAKGLMQLMDDTGRGLGVTDPFDPKQNIQAGTQFLADLIHKYNGNEGVALAAYNAGPGRVDRLGIKNDQDLVKKLSLLPEETQQYVRKVLNTKQSYESQLKP